MADLRGTVRRAYMTALSLLGRERVLVRRLRARGHVLVLNLHRVTPVASPFWPPLRPELFDELVGFLKRRVRLVSLNELDSVDASEPAAVLSFDDGYYDFIEYAVPILRAHGVRANMNVIPACVDSGRPIWNVRLYDALAAAPDRLICELRVPGFSKRFVAGEEGAKSRFGAALAGFLKKRPRSERIALFGEVERWIERGSVVQPTRMMGVDDVKELARTHEIGAHSFDHESMGFEDDAFFSRDLDACFDYFRTRLSIPLTVYAFPNGSYRPSQVEVLLARGIKHVLLVDERAAATRGAVLPRLTIGATNRRELRLQALGQLARGYA